MLLTRATCNVKLSILFGDVGRSKLEAAKDRILEINPNVHVETYDVRITSENAMGIIREYDLVVDGTDNFPTRYLVNDACVLLGKPNVYGSIFRFEGQVAVFDGETRPMLPLPLPRSSATWFSALLR